jgi:hypothetical protein
MESRPENQKRRRTLSSALPLSYVANDGGTRTRNLRIQEGTPACASGRLDCQGTRQPHRHHVWVDSTLRSPSVAALSSSVQLRAQVSNPVLLVQSQVWSPFHQLALVWTERFELPTSGFRRRRASKLRYVQMSTHGESRTRTGRGLSAVPLPVGLREQSGPRGIRTRNLLLAGELRFLVAPPARW